MKLLGALEAEKLTKQKCKQYCGTPCRWLLNTILTNLVIVGIKICAGIFMLMKFVKILLASLLHVRGNLKKTNSIFKDIIPIEVDPPPSHPIFDKLIFDKVLIMTS